ncbi:two-component system sensor histidine kinase YesM [Paenibacillus castaneae]|uniref:sensor histidine kinase n=1 Tax=Paenibacillus castaneae TaxID=474957 RepID=UPI000C9A239B|nr:sensor histidine kinase [Paenibacillus castaneae]NIK79032.1 two-component system sensor histidine kinase YesM [Paenibacillus castaneae]
MKVRSLYENFVKNNLFMKMILLFTLITTATIVGLSYFMFNMMSESIVRNELETQKKAMDSVNSYMTRKYDSVQSIMLDVYRNDSLSLQLSYFLQNPFEDYMRYQLDQYADETNVDMPKGLAYFESKLENDTDIENLLLYSSEQQFLYVYKQGHVNKLIPANASHSYIPDAMALENNRVSVPNAWVRNAINQQEPKLYAVRVPITDKNTLKNLGQLLVYFNSEPIKKELESYTGQLKGYILVLGQTGEVLFDSSDRYYGARYPYADKINSLYDTAMLEQESYVTTLTQKEAGYLVVGVAPKAEVAAAYKGLKRTIILISVICIVLVLFLLILVVSNYAKRTNKIIRVMRKVKSGDLSVRIQDEKEDELGQISRSFNDMLGELTRYIDSVYKAEIKQKHSELAALQARVNPHFLYNTLEVIRMRAVSQGAKDVGEMIYSLSVLFKSFMQTKSENTLKDELETSRLYLELFRIRYKDKLSYEIVCDERLAGKKIMRMALQPIIENYVVHGLQPRKLDNHIRISVLEREGRVRIQAEDNGIGITEERLEWIRKSLDSGEEAGDSFGLRSVHERLKLLYGTDYGLEIDSTPGIGTIVSIEFPAQEEALHV